MINQEEDPEKVPTHRPVGDSAAPAPAPDESISAPPISEERECGANARSQSEAPEEAGDDDTVVSVPEPPPVLDDWGDLREDESHDWPAAAAPRSGPPVSQPVETDEALAAKTAPQGLPIPQQLAKRLIAALRPRQVSVHDLATVRPPAEAPIDTPRVATVAPAPTADPSIPRGPRGTAVMGVQRVAPSRLPGPASLPAKPVGPRGTAIMGVSAMPGAPRMDSSLSVDVPRAGSRRTTAIIAIGAAVAGALVAVILGGFASMRTPARAPDAYAQQSVEGSVQPPTAAATSAAASSTAQPAASASAIAPQDRKALAALEKLRGALVSCTKKLRQLPGTSPAVPRSAEALKGGPYAPSAPDWSSPFFHCTEFATVEPMPFMLQWQFRRGTRKGIAIAWVAGEQWDPLESTCRHASLSIL